MVVMPAGKNEEYAILQRQSKVAVLYVKNKTQWEIAHELGVDQATISHDLKAIRQYWLEKKLRAYDEKICDELAKIDRLECEALDAWERSKGDAVSKTHSEQTGAVVRGRQVGPMVRKSKTTEGRVGESRFLQTVQWCIETRLKLIGALKTTNDSNQAPVITFESLFKVQPKDPHEGLVEVDNNTEPPETTVPDYYEQSIRKMEAKAKPDQPKLNGHNES